MFYFFSGMDEVGIYRLSGATSEVRRLKDAFDNSKYIMEVNTSIKHHMFSIVHSAKLFEKLENVSKQSCKLFE